LVDRVQWLAGDVLDHGAHGAIVVGRLCDQNFDFLELCCDRRADTSVTGLDDITIAAVRLRRHDRRLDDADGLYGREQQCVGLRGRL
jgi:hypothetical protein